MSINEHKMYVTGDCHGERSRFTDPAFAYNKDLGEGDILFCCGDWGYIYSDSGEEKEFLNQLANKKYIICFVDGNHENFDLINSYPIEIWNGGKVHIIRRDENQNPKIIHLMRGQIYNIYGRKIFTFGGGYSFDRHMRKAGIDWWAQEMPSDEEKAEGIENMRENDFCVDYILTHTAPEDTMCLLYPSHDHERELNNYLEYIREIVKYERWYFGHLHQDKECWRGQYALLNDVVNMCTGEIFSLGK